MEIKDGISLKDIVIPDKFKDDEGYIITINDMTDINIGLQIDDLIKDGFGTKEYVENNLGIIDYYKHCLFRHYRNYQEFIYSERLRKKNEQK